MPHGYTKVGETADKLTFKKTHKNGDQTELIAESVPNGDRWFAHVSDEGRTQELGLFNTKSEAKRKLKKWAQNNPKGIPGDDMGISGFGGGIPGTDGNGLF